MRIARNSIFSLPPPSSLYEKVCTEEGCKEIGKNEMLQILAEKFDVAMEVLTKTEFFEEKILKYAQLIAREIGNSIPENISLAGKASWHVNEKYFEKAFVVRYAGLTLEQREQIAKAYNDRYGMMAMTYEGLYGLGDCADNLDGVFFNKVSFFSHLQDLIENRPIQNTRFIS